MFSGGFAVLSLFVMTLRREVFDYQTLSRSVSYAHALLASIPYVTADLILLNGLLRPQSYDHSWDRALAALCIFVVYTLGSIVVVVHRPSWFILHIIVLMAVCIFLLLLFLGALLRRPPENS